MSLVSPSRALRAEPMMMGVSSPGKSEVVFAEQFAHFHFDQFEQFGVVDHVGLVHVDDDVGHANLTGEQDVLAGLRHRAVGGAHHQDGAVHLGGAGDHVLDVVGVARAVDVGVVPVLGFVFDVGGVDGDAARLLFRRRVNVGIALHSAAELLRQRHGDRCGQCRLAMVHVPNRTYVHVRLRTLEFFLGHRLSPSKNG